MDTYNFNKLVSQDFNRREVGEGFEKIDNEKDQEFVKLGGEGKEDASLVFQEADSV